MQKCKKTILIGMLVSLYFLAAYTLMNHFGISCVFLEFFGIPCPGCGMTRALFALLQGDFYTAAKWNITIFFLPYVLVYLLFSFKHKIHNYLLFGVALIAIINWIIKILIL